jgi:uncharacterized protein YbjT (DUF2867 family)
MKLILAGATGLVGQHVLQLALKDVRIESVVTPVRLGLPAHPKLIAPVVNFDMLPKDASWWHADAVICTLGTTMKKAKTQRAFRRVDYDYPLYVAEFAKQHGTPTYVLNSAIGAAANSRIFYNKVKGELEQDLAKLGFKSLTYARPGLIDGDRQEVRIGELAFIQILKLIGPALPRGWRVNPAAQIAKVLLESAIQASPGINVITSDQLI